MFCLTCLPGLLTFLLSSGRSQAMWHSCRVSAGRLLDLLRRVYCFGVGLMKMDLRQESSRHSDAVSAVTK